MGARANDVEDSLLKGVAQGIPGITVAIAGSEGLRWAAGAGLASLEAGESVGPDLLFGIGSITKTFVAVVILQLAEERRLALNATAGSILDSALDGIANADRATISQLLNHTAAVRSWEDDPKWIREGRGALLDVNRIWGKTDPLAYIKGQAAIGAGGDRYSYSNTNYTILGMIIEKVTERDVVSEIRRRILAPLGIREIYLEGFDPVPNERLPRRYHWATAEFRRRAGVNALFREVRPGLIDVTNSNLSVEWAAGGMLATARDLALYGAALRDGRLLKPESMHFLTQWSATDSQAIKVGHGVFRDERSPEVVLIGHNGKVLGFSATLYWLESCDAVVAAMANVGTMHSGDVRVTLDSVVRSGEFLANARRLMSGKTAGATRKHRVTLPESIEEPLRQKRPMLWCNEQWEPFNASNASSRLTLNDVIQAERRLQRCSGLLVELFPELGPTRGIIESPLYAADRMQKVLGEKRAGGGRWLIKADHALPVAGSIKARGGIYEILTYAEDLALQEGIVKVDDDPLVLASGKVRSLFARNHVAVGSTGNLGLSIGIMAAALGFRATVHMSRDAKVWKKECLRGRGVEVVEHGGDYGAVVEMGREQTRRNPAAYFVDDEHSERLFLGYGVAALRLQRQLKEVNISVDAEHPLFVYLPCGVGGAPGGITFGLRHLFGDYVHCFFAEPVAAPCMLLRLASIEDRPVSVGDVGLDNVTEADGLAVGRASEFVARVVRPLVAGIFTVPDEELFANLYRLEQSEGFHIEPSAAAGFGGPRWILDSARGRRYLADHGLLELTGNATHIIWTTGGALVPPEEYRHFHERGRTLVQAAPSAGIQPG